MIGILLPAGPSHAPGGRTVADLSGGTPGAERPSACLRLISSSIHPTRVELVPTARAGAASGYAELTFAASPFGVTVAEDGRYVYEVTLVARGLRPRPGVTYVAWATTPELDETLKLGPVGEGAVSGRILWNKFLLFVTAEPSPDTETWEGPIYLTGLSPSGRMHMMAGHGIFELHTALC